jgi:hypothetical protein
MDRFAGRIRNQMKVKAGQREPVPCILWIIRPLLGKTVAAGSPVRMCPRSSSAGDLLSHTGTDFHVWWKNRDNPGFASSYPRVSVDPPPQLFNAFRGTPHPYPHGIGSVPRFEKHPGDVFQSSISTGHLISTSFKEHLCEEGKSGLNADRPSQATVARIFA